MMDINIFDTEIFPYLEGEALVGSTLTLTIRDIKIEEMKSHKGKAETKYVLYFEENRKGFVLNKTNAKRCAVLHGATTGNWKGKQITLCTEQVQAFGETHNALRVIENASPTNGGMNLVKLLVLLRKVEVAGMATFYEFPDDILACRAKGAPLPATDDTDGWRVLFTDARDYAIDRINEAIERGDMSPDELSIPPGELAENPDQISMPEAMAVDGVDFDGMALTVPDQTDEAPPIAEEPF